MGRLPSLKPRQVERILLKKGFFLKRQTGSHRIYFHPQRGNLVVVPFHSKEIPRGTLKSIVKQAGMEEREFASR